MGWRVVSVLATFIACVASGSLLMPAQASAVEHTAEFIFGLPGTTSPDGEAPLPAAQEHDYDRQIALTYNDLAGTVALATEVYEASYWGERHEPVRFSLRPSCSSEEREGLAGEWKASPGDPAAAVLGSVTGHVTMQGVPGSIPGIGSFKPGGLLSIGFQAPQFVAQRWVCLTISSGRDSYRTTLSGYLPAGSEPPVMAQRASPVQVATLAAAADGDHTDGFSTRRDTLRHAWLTDNGWAAAEPRSRHASKTARRDLIVFRYARDRWDVVAFGSAPCTARCSIPPSVREALAI